MALLRNTETGDILFGAGVYTWFMHNNGITYNNRLAHMIAVTAKAGFAGIETSHAWMGDLTDPVLLQETLAAHNIALSAVALVLDWNEAQETAQERKEADEMIALLRHFPGAVLCTVQMPTGRHQVEERRLRLLQHVNAVSRRAAAQGITCSFHPNSPHHSITRTQEDYAVLLEGLDYQATGWTPDVGHIINGGMDPLHTMQTYETLINHVHFKDWDGNPEFVLMGNGKVDFGGITNWLHQINYNGWIVCEDEGKEATEDPDGVTLHDGRWIRETLLPQLNK